MNDDKNSTNENHPSGGEPTKDKIPLWLQGLNDEDKDEAINLPVEQANAEDSWVKEIEQEVEELVDNGDTQSKANKEVQLPDWILENAEAETEEPVSNDLLGEGEEKTEDEDLPLEALSNAIEPDAELAPNEHTDHGFIDISELDMEASREPVQFIPIEEEDVNEELPAWLHDMINDQPDQPVIQTEKEHMEQQLKENEQATAEQAQADLETKQETWQEITTVDDQGFTEQEQAISIKQFSEQFDEDVTKPVQIEPGSSDEWVQVEDASIFTEEQNPFERAEAMLNQGNFNGAIALFRQQLEQSPIEEDLDKIQTLIDNSIDESGSEKSALLELKGDVALKKNDPSGAFQGYSQALKALLLNQEVEDGNG